MALRTVRLDQDAEAALERIVRATGLSISSVLIRGIHSLHEAVSRHSTRTPYDVYADLDLGPGGYAIAPSTDTRRGVRKAIRRKLGRRR